LRFDAPDLRVHGASQQDSLGTGLGAGDVDGDGVDDLLMGATGRVYKQLGIPPAEEDFAGNIADARLWVRRGAPVRVVLDVEPQEVGPGGVVEWVTSLANHRGEERDVRVLVYWRASGADPELLKDKMITVPAGIRRIPREFPIAASTPPGVYGLEVRLENPDGTLLDRDLVTLTVSAP
jgi:hypothetical protein